MSELLLIVIRLFLATAAIQLAVVAALMFNAKVNFGEWPIPRWLMRCISIDIGLSAAVALATSILLRWT